MIDPRTGEIIKGQVTLGALRVRQDYLIAEGLLAPYAKGKDLSKKIHSFVLARIRQLAAHETGHTLGLAHNFAASVDNRASVMDYPYPDVKIAKDGTLDVSSAYAVGIGAWDVQAIQYGYEQFPAGSDEHAGLDAIIQSGISKGLHFLSDEAARPAGSASPVAHLWDNGGNAIDQLQYVMKVRAAALDHFGEGNIQTGMPLAHMEDVLVPLYMFHRYQVTAAAKLLGGVSYSYAVKGDGQPLPEIVKPAEQRRALKALLAVIRPDALALPENIRNHIPPQPNGYGRTREDFKGKTGLVFDALAPAESAAELTVGLILDPERDTRLEEYHAEHHDNPGLGEVIDALVASTWRGRDVAGYDGAIERHVNTIVLNHLMALANNDNASEQVRAVAFTKIDELRQWMARRLSSTKDSDWKALYMYSLAKIKQYQENPAKFKLPEPVTLPPGDPIGEWE